MCHESVAYTINLQKNHNSNYFEKIKSIESLNIGSYNDDIDIKYIQPISELKYFHVEYMKHYKSFNNFFQDIPYRCLYLYHLIKLVSQ